MENKNKNILIGGLLAIVLVMAVGYAAFATQLQVSGTAKIDSTWNVHFDKTKTDTAVVTAGGSATPATTETDVQATPIVYGSDTAATIKASLKQPGDKIVYTFTVLNEGTIAATLPQTPTLSSAGNDFIKFTVSDFDTTSLAATNGTATFTVTVEYVDVKNGESSATPTDAQKTATTTVTFSATQA